ncbi:restriction endonuclease subunit S [Helicobacter suis]|uniref:restriction endonuclease subunit S n=2 Tax=Helicobacter suis TaxID=104628 RepID=UPI0013D41B9B|nr:restriction endonuclease subunit S [Helicobacter suis]
MGILDSFKRLLALHWQEVRVGDLFEVQSSNKILHANQLKEIIDIPKEGYYPYVVRSARNNGIRGFIKEDTAFLNPGNSLSFAMDTFSVFYQERPYFTGNNVKILVPKFNLDRYKGLFIATTLQKSIAHLGWGTNCTINDIETMCFSLPHISTGKVAFEAMQVFIREIQAERLREIQAYLKVTGLENTTLTEAEENALSLFTNNFDSCGGGGGIVLLLSA